MNRKNQKRQQYQTSQNPLAEISKLLKEIYNAITEQLRNYGKKAATTYLDIKINAIRGKQVAKILLLEKYAPDVGKRNRLYSLIHYAAEGDTEVFKFLLQYVREKKILSDQEFSNLLQQSFANNQHLEYFSPAMAAIEADNAENLQILIKNAPEILCTKIPMLVEQEKSQDDEEEKPVTRKGFGNN